MCFSFSDSRLAPYSFQFLTFSSENSNGIDVYGGLLQSCQLNGRDSRYWQDLQSMSWAISVSLFRDERCFANEDHRRILLASDGSGFLSNSGSLFINSRSTLYSTNLNIAIKVNHPAAKPRTKNTITTSYFGVICRQRLLFPENGIAGLFRFRRLLSGICRQTGPQTYSRFAL